MSNPVSLKSTIVQNEWGYLWSVTDYHDSELEPFAQGTSPTLLGAVDDISEAIADWKNGQDGISDQL